MEEIPYQVQALCKEYVTLEQVKDLVDKAGPSEARVKELCAESVRDCVDRSQVSSIVDEALLQHKPVQSEERSAGVTIETVQELLESALEKYCQDQEVDKRIS